MKKQAPQKAPTDIEILQNIAQQQLQQNVGAQLTPALATGLLNLIILNYAQYLEKKAKSEEKPNVPV